MYTYLCIHRSEVSQEDAFVYPVLFTWAHDHVTTANSEKGEDADHISQMDISINPNLLFSRQNIGKNYLEYIFTAISINHSSLNKTK